MSQMFKNVLNSINGHSRSQKSKDNKKRMEESRDDVAKLDLDSSESNGNTKKGNKKNRIKLSNVMVKLQSSMTRVNKFSRINGGRNNETKASSGNEEHKLGDNEDEDEYLDAKRRNSGFESLRLDDVDEEEEEPEGTLETDKVSYDILQEEQCDIPTFRNIENCDDKLIEETRELLQVRYAKNPESFYEHDYKRMLEDDWTVSRFLLRRRLDPKRTAKLMEECGRFRKQYKMSEVKLWEFPIEFHQAGGLFKYAPDRAGNPTIYMRVKMYRRVPEINDVFKAFILCVIEECDMANEGRGVAVVFDLSGASLQNVDLSFLSWLLSSFRNYCPKGVSYILVYNLPWFLNATCKLAMSWMSASNRRCLRFVHGDEIEAFIARENLPDYLGGTCKIDYRAIPEGSRPAIEVCEQLDITPEQALKIRDVFAEYLPATNDDSVSNASSCAKSKKTELNEEHKVEETKEKTNGVADNLDQGGFAEDDDDQFVDCQVNHHRDSTLVVN